MMTFYFQIAVSAVLIIAAVSDMKSGRIPNGVGLVLVAMFAALAFTTMSMSEVLWQLGFATCVFAFGLIIYALAGAGAGAVKLMAAAALFMPIDRGFALFGLLLGTMFGLGLIVGIVNRIFRSEDSKWKVLKTPVMPLSLPVAATGLMGMYLL